MSPSKPVILIVSGGWHTPPTYSKLTTALQAAGYEVHCPHHPSNTNARPPVAGLAEDTRNMRTYAKQLVEGGRRVVALAHSYGGQVASNSLHGLGEAERVASGQGGGVVMIIYLAAIVQKEGASMVDKVEEMGHEHLMPIAFNFADDRTVVCADPKTQLIGEYDNDAESQAYLATLELFNGDCMYQPITHCAWRDVPVAYIHTHLDATTPIDYQRSCVAMMEKEGRAVRVFDLPEAGHCPNLTQTEAVVDIIKQVTV